jgi:hypothetical protein
MEAYETHAHVAIAAPIPEYAVDDAVANPSRRPRRLTK